VNAGNESDADWVANAGRGAASQTVIDTNGFSGSTGRAVLIW
jgi:hypothetical protein